MCEKPIWLLTHQIKYICIGSWFNPRNVISVAVWIHSGPGSGPPPVAKFLPWFSVTSFVQWRFLAKGMNLVANKIHFVIAYLCPRGGGTQAIFMCGWMNSEILWASLWATFTQVFMPYWNFETPVTTYVWLIEISHHVTGTMITM